MKATDGVCSQKGHGTNNSDFTSEERLLWQHGGYLGTVEYIDKKSLNKIIRIVAKGDLVAIQSFGLLEKCCASKASAEKTGVLPVFWTMRSRAKLAADHLANSL